MENGSFIKGLIEGAADNSTVEVPWGEFQITEPLTIQGAAGITLDLRRSTLRFPKGPQRWITFANCPGLTLLGGEFIGSDTQQRVVDLCTASNAAGKEPTSADFTTCLTFEGCEDVRFDNPFFQGFDRAIEVHKSNEFKLREGKFIGHYDGKLSKWKDGALDPINKDVLRCTYQVNVRNSHYFSWIDGQARSAGGAVVAGSGNDGGASKFFRIEKLRGWTLGDNGVYGSATPYSSVERCQFWDCKGGHSAKLRGNGCVITRNESFNGYMGFMVEGVGKTADELGAAAYGQEISFNLIENASDGAIQVDQTAEGNLFPRHLQVIGNRAFKCGTAQVYKGKPIRPPFCLDGGHGYLVSKNIVVGYTHDCFLYLGSPSAGTFVAADNVLDKKQKILVGTGTVDVAPLGQAF